MARLCRMSSAQGTIPGDTKKKVPGAMVRMVTSESSHTMQWKCGISLNLASRDSLVSDVSKQRACFWLSGAKETMHKQEMKDTPRDNQGHNSFKDGLVDGQVCM